MNYIEFDVHSRQHTFILLSEQKVEVKYIQIGNKNVDFIREELGDKRQGFTLDIQQEFPVGISFEVTLSNKEEEIPYEITNQGILPLFGRMPGVLFFENQRMYVKFLFLNDILDGFNQLPIINDVSVRVNTTEFYTTIAFKDIKLDSWENIFAVASQGESNIKQVVPAHLTDNELVIANKYTNGLFNINLMFTKGKHIFRVNFSNDDDYLPLIEQTQTILKNNDYRVTLNSFDNKKTITLKLNSSESLDRVMLLSNDMYIQGDYNAELREFSFAHIASFRNVKDLYLFIARGNQYYYEDLKEVLKESGRPLHYIDNTLYNFNLGYIKNSEELSIHNISVDGSNLDFEIQEKDLSYIANANPFLLLKLRKGKQIKYVKGERDNQKFTFDFTYLLEEIENFGATRWDFYLVNDYKAQQSYHLGDFEETILEKPKRFFKLFKQDFLNNSTFKYHSRIYITINNELAMVKNTISNLIKEEFKLKLRVTHFYMKKNIIEMNISINSPYTDFYQLGSFYLIQRNKDKIDKRKFEIQTIKSDNGKTILKTKIDLTELEFTPIYWDPYISIISDDKEYYVRINAINKSLAWDINETITKYQYNMAENDIFYPYITLGNNISFTYREKEYFENRYYLFKENLAYLIVKTFPKYFEERRIWLAFEKMAMSAHDSGYYFFDYMYKNQKHDEFYYIIQKNSPEMKNLADKKDKVIYFMSFKYFVYMFASKLLISSDTKRNSYNLKLKKSKLAKILTNKKLVYLQHGVNGLKRVPDFHKNRDVFDLVIAPSEFEKQMIVNDWGYDESEVAATGLARWDGLVDRTEEIPYKQIFLMPTWRTWMDGMEKDKFKESEYFKKYNEFLSSEKLHALLEEHNVKIKFFLHPKFREYIDLFDSKSSNIEKFGFLEVPMDEMIMKSSLMISDYSSVIWEMFYLKKPCVFFHFDKEKYLEYEGAYMDFDTDLFGDVAYKTPDLISIIENYIQNGFEEKNEYAEMRNEYFTFMDNHNSERIYEAIEENKDWLISDSLKIPKFKLSHLIPYSVRRKILDIKNSILK